jgi:hypothetical protein
VTKGFKELGESDSPKVVTGAEIKVEKSRLLDKEDKK